MDHGTDDSTIATYVSRFGLDRSLPEPILRNLRLRRFDAFETILREDGTVSDLYLLVEGRLQCTHFHMNGKAAVLAVVDPFSAIGDLEVLNDHPIRSNVFAIKPTTTLAVSKQIVQRHGADDPRFLRFLLDEVRRKLIDSNAVQMTGVLPVASRCALMVMSKMDADGVAELPSKEILASLLGTTQRHLNRVMNEFVHRGVIDRDYPRVRVLDRDALEAIVEE